MASWNSFVHNNYLGDFPGGPAVKISLFNARGAGLVPGQAARIPHTPWPRNQNTKQKQCRDKSNEAFKNGPHQKKKKKLTRDLVKMSFKFSRSGVCKLAQSLQLRLTLCDPMDCSPLGSSVHGILQTRILEWVARLSFGEYSRPRDQTCVSLFLLAGRFFTTRTTTWEDQNFVQTQIN